MTTTTETDETDETDTGPDLEWVRPGPGTWQLDSSHFEADCARISQEVIARGMGDGMADGFDRMGGPLKGLAAAFVNGSFYYRLVPLVGSDRDLPTPPAPVLWVLTRLHPAFRRQEAKAARTLGGRLWNDELREWEDVHRPYLVETSRRLTGDDPGAMTDDQLADHIDDVLALVHHGTRLHFRLHVSDLGPIGLLLVRARDWGLDRVEVMATLAGSSPATSAPMVALARLAATVAHRAPFTDLDQVRAVSPRAATLLDDFLAEYGWRLTTGYDLQELTLNELPELVLNALNQRVPGRDADSIDAEARQAGQQAAERLRQQLDPADRPEFDRLVADARALYGLRDENGPLTYQWPAGLLRRAMLEAGRRLAGDGRLADPAHVFDLAGDELGPLVRGDRGPGPAELAARCRQRAEWKRHRAPAQLGPDAAEPPLWVMTPALARIMDVVLTVMDLIETRSTEATLDGIGIGTEPYVGRARVVVDEVDALARMEPGDVLIAPFTVPTYNAALACAGAVVVENGGLLCHAAVIAREYGIAGLVGVTGVTSQITDGELVRVDPAAGTIRQLDRP